METNKNTSPDDEEAQANSSQDAPADALSRTPEDLEQEQSEQAAASGVAATEPVEKISPIKKFFRKVNVYFLGFVLLAAVAGIITWVIYLNSQKPAAKAEVESQAL